MRLAALWSLMHNPVILQDNAISSDVAETTVVVFDVTLDEIVLSGHIRKFSDHDCFHALELFDHVVTFCFKHFVLGNGTHLTPDTVAENLYLIIDHVDFLKSFV